MTVDSSVPPEVLLADDPGGVPAPRWLAPYLRLKEGRDPLGLQTTTQDRLMPLLLPGILELSRRGRYFSLYAYLLSQYQQAQRKPEVNALSAFLKRAEWDFGLAVQRCPRKCGSSPVGTIRLGGTARGEGPFVRGESVESTLGGYGLYYRTPMIVTGLVAPAGTLLGDAPIPIDVLSGSPRALTLAEAFTSAVADTSYHREGHVWTIHPLPPSVIDEYADVACLCQLAERIHERDAVHAALFEMDSRPNPEPVGDSGPAAEEADVLDAAVPATAGGLAEQALTNGVPVDVEQRRRSVAHYLTLVAADPAVVDDERAFRRALWEPPTARSSRQELVAGQWAALAAKDVWQEVVCSLWTQFCAAGREASTLLGRGLTWEETQDLVPAMLAGNPSLEPMLPTSELARDVGAGHITLPEEGQPVSESGLDDLRAATRRLDSATSGLVVLLELSRRSQARTGAGWLQANHIGSAWQPSLAAVTTALTDHLAGEPTVADTMWWLVNKFVIPVHESIAYSKLPDNTFRFRWEEGLLRFFHKLPADRFRLAAVRNEVLALITRDLGLWARTSDDEPAQLTARGEQFVSQVFG